MVLTCSDLLYRRLRSNSRPPITTTPTVPGSGTLTINPYPPEIWIFSPLERTPLRVFVPGEGEFTLLPGGKVAYTLVWDQRNESGQQVSAGTYNISVMQMSVYKENDPQPVSLDAPAVVQVEILPG